MDNLEEISFKIISGVGAAKSAYVQAIALAREKKITEAQEKMNEGKDYFLLGHKAHSELLALNANDENLHLNVLIVHAEDQLMSAETIELMATEFILLYQKII